MIFIEKRISKRGTSKYRAKVQVAGAPNKTKTFIKRADAADWAARTESDMRAGAYGAEMLAHKHTVADMIKRYLDNVLESKSTKLNYIKSQRIQLTWWLATIGEYKLAALTPAVIAECKDKLAGKNFSERKPATVNRYLAALNQVINTAIKEWRWMRDNPVNNITKPKEANARLRYLTKEEMPRLMEACKRERRKPLALVVLLALLTGARKNEILTLKIRDVELERGVAVVYETKNSEPRRLYLCDMARDGLADYIGGRPRSARYVFAGRGDVPINIEVEWRRALKRAGIDDFRFHDLRHTFASYFAMSGGDMAVLKEVLGHKDLTTTNRYTHLSSNHVGDMVRGFGNNLFNVEAVKETYRER